MSVKAGGGGGGAKGLSPTLIDWMFIFKNIKLLQNKCLKLFEKKIFTNKLILIFGSPEG